MTEKIEPTVEEVQELFEEWRRNKKRRERIPEALWKVAISLSKQFSAQQISKLLHLNHTAVRDHIRAEKQGEEIQEKEAAFIEFGVIRPTIAEDCIIEIEKRSGAKMRMSFKCSSSDMAGLAKTLWGEA
jgi:NTP pyrophosphatase (non-canonical NTP hydrolase)